MAPGFALLFVVAEAVELSGRLADFLATAALGAAAAVLGAAVTAAVVVAAPVLGAAVDFVAAA